VAGAGIVLGPAGPAGSQGHSTAGTVAPTSSATPLLSVRRVPGWIASTVAAERLDAALSAAAAPALGSSPQPTACLAVSQGGRLLFAAGAGQQLIPASNMKILTATAVLDKLGPSSRFVTQVMSAGAPSNGVVYGNLYLVGGGDPLLRTASYVAGLSPAQPLYTSLNQLAQQVRNAGITKVTGSIVGVESRYDSQRVVPTWKAIYSTELDVGPLSALEVNDGLVLKPAPPAPHSTTSTTTAASDSTTSTTKAPAHSSTTSRPLVWTASTDPPVDGAAQFATLLRGVGVRVEGGATSGQVPAGGQVVTSIDSPPMSQEVDSMLRVSDDTAAELFTKELGYRIAGSGTTAAGTAVIRADLAADGLPVSHMINLDGSGLDRGDLVSCGLILDALQRAGATGVLAAGLPIAGQTGTLAKRMLGTPAVGRVRAKTGTLDGVSSLSGFVMPAAGTHLTPILDQPLVFSLILNGMSQTAGDSLADRIAETLAQYPQIPALADLGPRS
jgi:serine-type D-Ala-D-Ala carboxypeptidase/endopeptidase (penicillin-binding protein 4)